MVEGSWRGRIVEPGLIAVARKNEVLFSMLEFHIKERDAATECIVGVHRLGSMQHG
jgi:hypothetical protein